MMSSFTPDSELELLFHRDLLPQKVIDEAGDGFHASCILLSPLVLLGKIRPLSTTDHSRNHVELLSVLTVAPTLSIAEYSEITKQFSSCPDTYYPIIILQKSTDKIVATGTLFVERKFIRGGGKVGHIEDIAVAKEVQGRKFGGRLIEALTGVAESVGCYKVILDCNRENMAFYEKCGFQHKEYEMVKYTTPVVQNRLPSPLVIPADKKGDPDSLVSPVLKTSEKFLKVQI